MQQLYFHPTWDKAISPQDRTRIEEVFEETYTQVDDVIMSPLVRAAINHKGELLVMVLVHNFTHHSARFVERSLFVHCDDFSEQHVMTIPALSVPPFTSMPWTFIFPASPIYKTLELEHVVLEIDTY